MDSSHQIRPQREVRATFDHRSIIVYQAYGDLIADRALSAGRLVPPFSLQRMTWIKPSFLWLMYRSAWATRAGQNRVLAIAITRDGFEWALAHGCLSHFEAAIYGTKEAWEACKNANPVRTQWDPERSLLLKPLPYRSIQVGLAGEAIRRYASDWILQIEDVTERARHVRGLLEAGQISEARDRLPVERPYPLPDDLRHAVGASESSPNNP
jgi:hypothetical protein